jgi:transcriptional regulator with XRE-family HTH domain
MTQTDHDSLDGPDDFSFGGRLTLARKRLGLTQHALSKLTGIAQATIGSAETKGRGSLYCARLAKALGVNALWLESGQGEMLIENQWPFTTFDASDIATLSYRERVFIETTITNYLLSLLSGHGFNPPVMVSPLVPEQEAHGNVRTKVVIGKVVSLDEDDQTASTQRIEPIPRNQGKKRQA